MKNLTKEMEGIDLRNLPATAPLFARVFAEAVGARECAYPEMALHVARLAACFYLRSGDDEKWARYAVTQVLCTRNAHKVVVTWAAVELRSDISLFVIGFQGESHNSLMFLFHFAKGSKKR